MGNCMIRCLLRRGSSATTAYIFDIQGLLQRVELPAKAAELMLEAPGSIVCPVDELKKSRAIWALRADEELQAGRFYLMFPAKRVYCKASEMEIKLITTACRNKGRIAGPKVVPSAEEEEDKEGVSSQLLGEDCEEMAVPGFRLSMSKQWRPMLEPISENS